MIPAQGHTTNWTFVPKGTPEKQKERSEKVLRGYRFGFNGKELDESGHHDFGARNYDARIGRFTSIDDMASLMASRSPYSFAANNPVLLIDKGGDLPILPMIFKGLVGAGIDAMMQFTINMVIYDFDPQKAFENIDAASVALSGVQGMIPWNPPGGKWGQSAFDVMTDLTANFVQGNYNGLTGEALHQQLFVDVLIGAGVSGGTGVLGKKLEAHLPKIAVWLKEKGIGSTLVRKITGIDVDDEIRKARRRGVERAKAQEVRKIVEGGTGYDPVWSDADLDYIRQNKKLPPGVVAHHINSVKKKPTLAADPGNIMFLNGGSRRASNRLHLNEHLGSFRNATRGKINRSRRADSKSHRGRRHTTRMHF